MSDAPIGVFDSGLGGLTVVAELMRQLPHESIIYFGDTARLPYGPKSVETVQRYSREIAEWLQGEGVKSIVVACNTATAHALPMLQEEFAIPVMGVVQPGARAAVRASRNERIGVIGTAGTIASGAYERAIHSLAPHAFVAGKPCPLFVPLVEEGWLDTEATRMIAHEYLTPLQQERTDTLVLGCTHYPLLKPLLADIMGPSVTLIDSAEETAAEAAMVLDRQRLLRQDASAPLYRFVASDAPQQFLCVGQRFLGTAIDGVEKLTLG